MNAQAAGKILQEILATGKALLPIPPKEAVPAMNETDETNAKQSLNGAVIFLF